LEREATGVSVHALGGPIPHSRAATGKTAVDTEDPAEAAPLVPKAWDEAYFRVRDSEGHFSAGKKYILKTKIFKGVTSVLNERKHLKIVFRSVQDSASLFLDRSNRPGLTALHLWRLLK
jgi:hypothetical protein